MARTRQLEAVKVDLFRTRALAVVRADPLNDTQDVLRMPVRTQDAQPLARVSDPGSHVSIELHRFCHGRLYGDAAKAAIRERREHCLYNLWEFSRPLDELTDPEHARIADESEEWCAIARRPGGVEDRDGNGVRIDPP